MIAHRLSLTPHSSLGGPCPRHRKGDEIAEFPSGAAMIITAHPAIGSTAAAIARSKVQLRLF
jgi:hypothetical protein